MDLEVQEAILAKEQVCDLLPSDRRDLPIKLEERERASEVGQLSQLVMGISNALVDLGMVPI
jgi:hypothetical protein